MRKISLPKYVAYNTPHKAQLLLRKYRVPRAKNYRDLKKKLRYVIVRFKENALHDIAGIHPDRELFEYMMSASGTQNTTNIDPNADSSNFKKDYNTKRDKEKKSSACGCGGGGSSATGEKKSCCGGCSASASGKTSETKQAEQSKQEPSKTGEMFGFNKNELFIGIIGIAGLTFVLSRTIK